MLNCFYWYSIIWIIVLILYNFGFSTMNIELDVGLKIFLLISITSSILLGCIYKKNFKFYYDDNFQEDDEVLLKKSKKEVIYLICSYFIEFFYSKGIPIISIVFLKNSKYGDYAGIPIFHVVLISFSTFFAQKFFYSYILSTKNKNAYLKYYLIIMFLFLLCYYRSMIIINLFMSFLIYIKNKKLNIHKCIFLGILVLLILYLYGGIGNLRDGYSWNDSTYMNNLASYRSWPEIIPKQYMWIYTYVTSPLANLNYNIVNDNTHDNISFIAELMPEPLAKRIIPANNNTLLLIVKYLTASTGYCKAYINFGYFGMYLLYSWLIVITLIILNISKKANSMNKTIMSSMLVVVFTFMFFYNTLSYIGIIGPCILCFLSMFKIKKRKIINKENSLK